VRQIGQPMHLLKCNVAVLPNRQVKGLVTKRDAGCALHHHPVFCTMVVLLQADALPREHPDALDFVTRGFRHGFIPTPRAQGPLGGLGRDFCHGDGRGRGLDLGLQHATP
jgi:hypothetical protein